MQDNILLAFRKRLKNRGYYDISIIRVPYIDKNGFKRYKYQVSCKEPLNGTHVIVTHELIQFNYLMR